MSQPFASHRLVPGWFPFDCGDSDSLTAMISRWRQANFRGQIVGPHGCGKTTLTVALSLALGPEFAHYRWLTARSTSASWLRWLQSPRWLETPVDRNVAKHSTTLVGEPQPTQCSADSSSDGEDNGADADLASEWVTRRNLELSETQFTHSQLPMGDVADIRACRRECLFVDGWEPLAVWQRWWYWRRWSGDRCAVLITSHRPIPGLAVVAQLQPRLEVFRRFAQRCLDEHRGAEFESGSVVESMPGIVPAEIDAAFARHGGDFREALFALYDLYETKRPSAASASTVVKRMTP